MDLKQFIQYRLTQKNLVHDFSLGSLLAYSKLDKLAEKGMVRFWEDAIQIQNKPEKPDTFILYNSQKSITEYLAEGKKNRIVTNSKNDVFGKVKTKHEEVFYQLEKISEAKGNKLYHSFTKPIKIIEQRLDLGITLEDIAGQAGLIELHDEWVKYKLALPTTHRISFPTARYRNTLTDFGIPRYAKAIYIKGKLYGFIVFTIENGIAFELSFCTLFWKDEFKILNGLNQYIFSYCLIDMMKQGVRFVNSGYVLNKNLKIFKQTSQESTSVYRYTYEI